MLLFGMVAWSSCSKEDNSTVPNVSVNEYLVLSEPSNFALNAQGGWVYSIGGYRGLLVYRRYFNGDDNDFVAFDRACPAHHGEGCGKVEVKNGDLFVTCPCDNKEWVLFDGSPYNGNPASPLRAYRLTFQNGTIHIFN